MEIYRTSEAGVEQPYHVTFAVDRSIEFKEAVVAANALSFSPHDINVLELTQEQTARFDRLSNMCMAQAGEGAMGRIQTDLDGIKALGSGLLLFADLTEDETTRMLNNNPPSKRFYPARRDEGRIAQTMAEVITNRGITIPALMPAHTGPESWVPTRNS